MQNGHLGRMMINAVDKKDIKPLFRDGFLSKTISGLDLQHVDFWDSITAFYRWK